jgi:Family of unknown function (DUF5825)
MHTDTVLELDEPVADLDLEAAVRDGIQSVRIDAPQILSAERPEATLALVRLLREAAADGIPIAWHGEVAPSIDVSLLVHLPPPERTGTGTGDDHAAIVAWRERYRPGLCYFRLGPGFAFMKDVRDVEASARFQVNLAQAPRAIERLEAVATVDHLDAATTAVLEDLEAERLVLRLGELVTILPYRMRRWPVPSLEV